MKIKIQLLLYFLTSLICNAQANNVFKDFKKCNCYLIKDSISLIDNLRNFTLKLPKKWKGKFEGDNNNLHIYKTPKSSIFRLKGNSAYDVQGDEIEIKKKDPSFVGIDYIENQEIVILNPLKGMYKEKLLHKYTFHFETKDNPWVWMFYLVADRKPTKKDVCELKYIIKQYILNLKIN
ncbi:conserved exported protein of unknown function [Tenacibaculum sp. 190524A02b]|uniref:hypothetical protein n=1 Tax=Tenacibaculum vairaonense TaxID=3137860 RepID=UPI0032B27103